MCMTTPGTLKKTEYNTGKKENISQCACSGIHVPDKRDNC